MGSHADVFLQGNGAKRSKRQLEKAIVQEGVDILLPLFNDVHAVVRRKQQRLIL